jgi:hypothetical protein
MIRSTFSRLQRAYVAFALIGFNLFLLFVIANFAALPFVDADPRSYDRYSHRDTWLQQYGMEPMRRVYPGQSDQEILDVMAQTGRFGLLFEPFIHTRSEPVTFEHTAIHPAGFRLIGREQGPWPMSPKALNLFVFGGSTAVGSGVRDHQAIPAVLQRLLRAQIGEQVINVYNFATAGHFSTQERIYFEQLIMHGHAPNAVVFVDGLNDFYFWNDEPSFGSAMRQVYMDIVETNHLSLRPAVRAVLQRLPLAQVVRSYYRRHIGGMPKATLFSAAYAQEDNFSDPSKIEIVIERYFRFKNMVEAVAQRFGITPIFVWQPVPLYKSDPKLRLFPVKDDHRRHEFGYPAMAQTVAARDMGNHFVWCADVFEHETKPVYLDSVHYTVDGNETVAGCVAQAIVQRRLLDTTAQKGR